MSHPRTRSSRLLALTGAALALTMAMTGCSGGDKKKAAQKTGPPPPAPSEQPESAATSAPGSVSFKKTVGLRKPVRYDDKISVVVADIRHVKPKADGPGEVAGKVLTIFTLRFANGSPKPLDLNNVRVQARYGPKRTQAAPASYANLNDFYGTVAPGKTRSASYVFDVPSSGYKSVLLGVAFSATHKTAVFAGSLHR
ncbi:hypothetical protein [Spirillospora sp. CA-294931]|uniref:hypothetical protein n=1 Tax=Spirillospora sp. CA-294931 TaxID=3240042 RepID=UPI003D8AB161